MNAQSIDLAITSRRSIRAFLPTPLDIDLIKEILQVARRAPSGTNTQPWKVTVIMGATKQSLSDKILAISADPEAVKNLKEEYEYYPNEWKSPYIDRRRKTGWDLYGLLGIERKDKEKMKAQEIRNYSFFDAPAGLIFSLDKAMGRASLLDYGMFLQNIMIAARARGLDTCAQAAFCPFHHIIRSELAIPESDYIVCGMALGYADPSKIENTLVTDREEVDTFTRFLDSK